MNKHEGELLKNRMKGSGKLIGEIAVLLGMSRQNLNHHLRKDELDPDFKRLFLSKEKVIFQTENITESQLVNRSSLNLIELSACHSELVRAHALQGEAILSQTRQGESLVETNKLLVAALANSDAPSKTPPILSYPSTEMLEKMALGGVKEKLWKTKDEGLLILGRLAIGDYMAKSQ